MYGRTHVAKKNSPNYTSTPQTNPFAPRSFGEDTPQQSPATKSQEELDAAYEHAKRLNSNWADIPVFPPGKEPNPPFNSQLSIQARYHQYQNSLMTSPENPIQRQCDGCVSEAWRSQGEEKESQPEQEIQTKLTVGAAGDPYEQEADRVAAQVMSMSDTSPQVQRLEEDEKPVQMSSLAQSITPVVQRQVDEQIQMKLGETQASGDVESRLHGSKGGGSPLAPEVRAFMEPRFGADFSGVRVHTGGDAVQMSKDLGAQAFTHGSDVYYGAGKSPGVNELTAHELTHVVQQTGKLQRQGIIQRQDDPPKNSGGTIEELKKALDGWGTDSAKVLQLLRQASADERRQILANGDLMGKLRSKLGRSEMLQVLEILQASLKEKLTTAMNGWGCDAQVIKQLTASAADEDKKAVLADTALTSRLAGELSREDMLIVLGNINAPLKARLIAAMNGWGCDAQVIKQLTASAADEDKKAVLADTALTSRLAGELSREDMLIVLGNINAPLKTRLIAAMNGWGCDAQVIKQLTASATDEDKKAVLADTALTSRLAGELSREDMLIVLGNINAPLKARLIAAMNGWGADKAAIGELIIKATPTERDAALADAELLSRLSSELSLVEMMGILKDANVPFKKRFELALNNWSAKLDDLRPIIEAATDAERQTVWSDAALMTQANTALGEQDYLTLLTVLRMFQPGTTSEDGRSHTSAADADTAIQTHLATYVVDAIKSGRKISGMVAVVGDADWDIAGQQEFGADWPTKWRNSINGFVDNKKGRVWIHKDRGNAGTMIHEAIHKYSDDALIGISQPLNEGVTEYFTRKVCSALTPPITGRGNYQNNYDCVVVLVGLISEATLASAYFDGTVDTLKNAFITAKSEGDWNNFITATKGDDWVNATKLCTP